MSTYINKCYPNDNVSSPNKIENDDVIRMTTRTICRLKTSKKIT